MCSIMAYCGSCADPDKFKKGFDRTVSRGPDKSRIVNTGNGLLGFHRLAIMGLTCSGMQPFGMDGSYVVCNGELYGFAAQRELLREKGYSFQSDSDCEIILPMYKEYGTDMFAMLDAEFACVLYDGQTKEFIAAPVSSSLTRTLPMQSLYAMTIRRPHADRSGTCWYRVSGSVWSRTPKSVSCFPAAWIPLWSAPLPLRKAIRPSGLLPSA